jgi:hypothetical protein
MTPWRTLDVFAPHLLPHIEAVGDDEENALPWLDGKRHEAQGNPQDEDAREPARGLLPLLMKLELCRRTALLQIDARDMVADRTPHEGTARIC